RTKKKFSEEKRLKFEYPEFYFKSQEEMAELFADIPEALTNTRVISDRCNVESPFPGPQLPIFEVPEGFDSNSYLNKLAHQGLQNRYYPVTEQLKQRLEYELSVIRATGYAGYFLLVWDIVRFAHEAGIPVGPGRGSTAGSLVAYTLSITDIDPLKHRLLFERFLNPERISLPDIDIDFCFERRGEIVDYVVRKYGTDRVAKIITFGTLKARRIIRQVAKVLDMPDSEVDQIAELIPVGPRIDLKKAMKLEPELEKIREKGEIYKQLFDSSLKLEGLHCHASTHVAGIIIGREDLTVHVPLFRDVKTGSISTQYTMEYLEDCGLIKMDFLGLRTLTLIKNTLKLLADQGIELRINEIPENDPATFRLLSEGRSTFIFQFESSGMQEILRRTKPKSISDLIALNALYRPGPMEFIDQFIKSKQGTVPIVYPLPKLAPILKETYGVIVYQEQFMEIARQVAGFSLGQADILRRAMGKKKPDVMAQLKVKFVKGARGKGYSQKVADRIYELLIPFAGFGFNKAHAAAYAVLAYQTAYLKANHTAEFMVANLTNEINYTDKLSEYIAESWDMGVEVLPPDINLSEREFTVRYGQIVHALQGIKGVSRDAVDEIITERDFNGVYEDFGQFLDRVNLDVVNKRVLGALVRQGAFDQFGVKRPMLFKLIERTNIDQ
ncbi:MAG TPA: DNA polymerase III subunit alpha, partial [bacterium]|nr:DNA polymerase III subunit alpha [bacterium]